MPIKSDSANKNGKSKNPNMRKWCRRADPALSYALGRTRETDGIGRITPIASSRTSIASGNQASGAVPLNVRYTPVATKFRSAAK
jgi:hypothetical protein